MEDLKVQVNYNNVSHKYEKTNFSVIQTGLKRSIRKRKMSRGFKQAVYRSKKCKRPVNI